MRPRKYPWRNLMVDLLNHKKMEEAERKWDGLSSVLWGSFWCILSRREESTYSNDVLCIHRTVLETFTRDLFIYLFFSDPFILYLPTHLCIRFVSVHLLCVHRSIKCLMAGRSIRHRNEAAPRPYFQANLGIRRCGFQTFLQRRPGLWLRTVGRTSHHWRRLQPGILVRCGWIKLIHGTVWVQHVNVLSQSYREW